MVLLAFAALAAQASLTGIVWEPLGEPGCGGAIVSLGVSPHNPQHLVSGGDMLGTAVSFDAGESWKPGMGLPSYEMATPTFHLQRTNEIWIGSCMGPFLSRDGGRSWQWRRTGFPKPCNYRYSAMIEKVLVDPGNPERLLAFGGSSRRWGRGASMGAIWISENGGDEWRRVGTITANGFTTNAVKGANIVKAWWSAERKPWANVFAEGAGWFSSLDGGVTWRRRKVSGLPGEMTGVTAHPTDPRIVWAVVAARKKEGGGRIPGSIWRSSDAGRTFLQSDAGIAKTEDGDSNLVTHFSEIEASPARPGRLYVSDRSWRSSAIWVSDDGGMSWRKGCDKGTIETACYAGPGCRISASPTEPDVAYAYNSEYVLKTTDAGRTWHDATSSRPASSPAGYWRGRGWNGWCSRSIVFNPYRRGQAVVQAMDAARGWLSDDGLKSWRYAHAGVSPWCGGVGAAFGRDGSIYLTTGQNGSNNGIVFSHDGGRTWSGRAGAAHGLPERNGGVYGGVWADPDDGRRAFALCGGKRYVTQDGGNSWTGEKIAQYGDFAADPTAPGRFYVKSADGVFETRDWKEFRFLGLPGAAEGRIACDARGRVLVCRGRTGDAKTRGLWRYDPANGRWTRLMENLLASAVAADPFDPTRLLLTTSDNPYHDFAGANGIFASTDDGRTWQEANEGLHVRRLTCVAFDPFDGETIVAGTLGGGFVKALWPRSPRLLPRFAIELFDGKTGTVSIASGEFSPPQVTCANDRTRLVWKGHPRLGAGFTAVAEGVKTGDATAWSFECSGNASGLPLGRVFFPVVDVPCAADGHLLYSPAAGSGTMGWKRRVLWKAMPDGAPVASTVSPGFRFVALLNGDAQDSYYVDVRDPLFHAGRFGVRKGPAGTARIQWVHDVSLTPDRATSCRLPYTATIRPYRGDWFEAAEFYRSWVKTTPRYAAAKSRDLSRLRDVALWMWNRGLAETVIPPVERFQADTGLKVALDWYWWFKEMPGTFYPDYWPPREGAAKFKADVQRLKAMGTFTQVYLNGMTWDEDAPSWKEGGLASVAMRRDGTYFSYAYNRFNPNHRLANLCGEAPKFHMRIKEQIAHLADCGFDSIYLDMIGCNAYGPCFNPAHRHAPGGGTHMTDNFRAYLSEVKKAHPGLMLSTEDCSEAYVDMFESNISTHSSYERHGWIGTAPAMEFVPVFQALYHGCAAVFGNYAIVDNVPYWDARWPMKAWWTGHEEHLRRNYPDQFAVEFCRGPVWGLQPSVHNFWLHHATNCAYAAEYRFICETAKFYHKHRDFLFDGEMRNPGKLECKRQKVAFAKVSVFDEKVAAHSSTLPVVFHNVWRAPDGRVAAILVNWSRELQPWRLVSPDVSGSGELPPRSWAIVFHCRAL